MRVDSASQPGTAQAPGQQRAEAWDTAVQFEKIFAREMLSGLRKTAETTGDGGGLFGKGPGSDTYTEWFDDNLAEQVVKTGRLGVAERIMEELERSRQVPPAPPQEPPLHRLETIDTGGIHVLA